MLSKKKKVKLYRTIIFLYGMKWSLTLRKEHWLRKFENRVLKKMIGPMGRN